MVVGGVFLAAHEGYGRRQAFIPAQVDAFHEGAGHSRGQIAVPQHAGPDVQQLGTPSMITSVIGSMPLSPNSAAIAWLNGAHHQVSSFLSGDGRRGVVDVVAAGFLAVGLAEVGDDEGLGVRVWSQSTLNPVALVRASTRGGGEVCELMLNRRCEPVTSSAPRRAVAVVELDHYRFGQRVKVFVVYGEHSSIYTGGVGAALVIDQYGADGCAGVAVVADPATRLIPLTG